MDEVEALKINRLRQLITTKGEKMSKPVDVYDMNFGDHINGGLVLVDFWAPWCGPCKMMGPVIEELAKTLDGKVKVCKLNVDDNPVTASKYNIMSIPTLMIFSDGEAVDTIIGAVPMQRIEDKLKQYLG